MIKVEDNNGSPYAVNYDLSNCDAEPIHLIRHFQQPAILLVARTDDNRVIAYSDNLAKTLVGAGGQILGRQWSELLDPDTVDLIRISLNNPEIELHNPLPLPHWRYQGFPEGANLIIQRDQDRLIFEFEPRKDAVSGSHFLKRIDRSLSLIQAVEADEALLPIVAKEIKQITDFSRIMVYRFDSEYNVEIVAEEREEHLEPYLGLWYPHTDIPRQARELFLRNQVRHIISTDPSNVSHIVMEPGLPPLDLSMTSNRGSSPIHLEYLRNMDVESSLVVAVVVSQKLWGMISCHDERPRFLDYRLRSVLGLMGRVLSGQLALHASNVFRNRVLQTGLARNRLQEKMMESFNVVETLSGNEDDLLGVTEAGGCIIVLDGETATIGTVPNPEEIISLIDWLREQPGPYYSTHQLFEAWPTAKQFSNPPAGLLSIQLGRDEGEFIVWLRPEVIQTVEWGGNPGQRKEVVEGKVRLHPNLSFAKWSESVVDRARPWETHQVDAALALRNDIKEVILRRYQQIRKMNTQLADAYEELEGFSYSVSHDLKAPLRHIRGFAEILREDYAGHLDSMGNQAIETILKSAGKMDQFINDILSFSKVGNAKLEIADLSIEEMVRDIWEELDGGEKEISLRLEVQPGPFRGDSVQIRRLIQNLLSNAIKYVREDAVSWVRVSTGEDDSNYCLEVEDNGIGFDMEHADLIFSAFTRLVADDDYQGTGIGLAIVQRVVKKHGGKIEVFSQKGRGTRFTIRFPKA